MQNGHKTILGVVGGLGPLASAEFLKTIYEQNTCQYEQEAPIVLMHSDPSFPDRTEAFLNGGEDEVLKRLSRTIGDLKRFSASRVVICCVTMHHLLPRLALDHRQMVVSLVDEIFASVGQCGGRHLLLCSEGTRRMQIFERHSRWPELKNCFVLPDDQDQHRIHRDLIYQIKQNCDLSAVMPLFESLLSKYQVSSFVAGCTEVHLLSRHLPSATGDQQKYHCIDPLVSIAQKLSKEIL